MARAVYFAAKFIIALCMVLQCGSRLQGQYEDEPLEAVLELADSKDDGERREAFYELVRRGEAGNKTVEAFIAHIDDGDRQVRYLSLLGLARVGEAALPAVPELLSALRNRDDQVRFRATDALGKIGPSGLSQLIEHWKSTDRNSRVSLTQAMGMMGPAIAPRKEELLKLFADAGGDEELEYYTAECLAKISPDDETLLLSLSSNSVGRIRELGIRCLADLANPSSAAQEALIEAARDSEARVRELGIIAVAKSQTELATKAKVVSAGLIDLEHAVRVAALTGLRKAKSIDPNFSLPIADLLETSETSQKAEVTSSLLQAMLILGPEEQRDLRPLLDLASAGFVDKTLLSQLIGRMGASAVAELLRALEENPELRPFAEQALVDNVKLNEEAIRNGLSAESSTVRGTCALAITELRPVTAETMQMLTSLLEESDPDLRVAGLAALERCAATGTELEQQVLDAVKALSSDSDERVRLTLVQTINEFPFSGEQKQAFFRQTLSDTEVTIQTATLDQLAQEPETLVALKEELPNAASNDNPEVRRSAVLAIGQLKGKQVDEAVTSLLSDCLQDQENSVRTAATESLAQLGLGIESKREEILTRFSANLADDEDLLRATLAAMRLAEEEAAPAANSVAALLQHPQEDIRVNAVKTLREISADQELLANQLTACLDDDQWTVRQASAEALGSLGEVAKIAVPKLFSKLGDEEDEDFARGAIREIDAAPAEMLPELLEGLESEERRKRFYSVFLIGKIGPEAAEALPRLKEMRSNSSNDRNLLFLRRFLDEAIKSIEQ